MKQQLAFAVLAMTLGLAACSKQEQPAQNETSQTEVQEKITPEQRAQIDALDKPIQDEKNTDVPESVANASEAKAE